MSDLVPLILIMGLVGGISSLLMIGSILGLQKSRRLKKQVAEAKDGDLKDRADDAERQSGETVFDN